MGSIPHPHITPVVPSATVLEPISGSVITVGASTQKQPGNSPKTSGAHEQRIHIDRVSAARSHNDLHPIGRLPAENIRDVFDCIRDRYAFDGAAPNLPDVTAVFHVWRVAAISYPALWRTIDVSDDVVREFGDFPLPHTPNELRRLETVLRRISDAGTLGLMFQFTCRMNPMALTLSYPLYTVNPTGSKGWRSTSLRKFGNDRAAFSQTTIPRTEGLEGKLRELSLEWGTDEESSTHAAL